MQYSLEIREHNRQAHIDVENEIQSKKDGLFTCIIRVNNGNIVDSVIMEHADSRKYLVLKSITLTQLTISRTDGIRSTSDPVRPDNI